MRSSDPATPDAVTDNLPLFPLGVVLFPGGRLPLRIFEQRYLELTKACLRDDSAFGVCLIRHGSEVGAPAEHETVGCSARITHWDMPHPSLFELECIGERIFRVRGTRIEHSGLIRGEIEWLAPDDDPVDPKDIEVCRDALQRFIERAGTHFFVGDTALDDAEWVSHRLAEIMPVDVRSKQALLEQRSPARRLAALARLLQPY